MTTSHADRPSRSYAAFIGFTLFTLAAFIGLLFLGIYRESRQQMRELMLTQARSLVDSVLVARSWNAMLGGVYALKTGDVRSNPYLEDPDVATVDGRVLTLKNPALMVVEISESSGQDRLFRFRMVGDPPLNPRNAPDGLEREALAAFRDGAAEFWRMERGSSEAEDEAVLRYMAPLRIEEGCLSCHADQGYKLGEIKGAISVSVKVGDVLTRQRSWFLGAAGAIAVAAVIFVGLILIYFKRLKTRIALAQALSEQLANTDPLTGVPNRRQLMARIKEELARSARTGQPLACALLDVDYFKRVNDTLGHPVGDKVLMALTRIVREAVRPYDLLGRFGGEEFLLVLPGTSLDKAAELADRVRLAVRERLAATAEAPLPGPVTISFGVAAARPGDSLESLVKRADDALYRAKENGRDRVEREE